MKVEQVASRNLGNGSVVNRACVFLLVLLGAATGSIHAGGGVGPALGHLAAEMDRFHTAFDVYTDVAAAGNHFVMLAKTADPAAPNAVTIDPTSTENPHSGVTSVKCTFQNVTETNWGGWYFMNGILEGAQTAPKPNWGDHCCACATCEECIECNAGIDLTGATTLSFWARGQQGGEKIEFFLGGVGRDPESGKKLAPCPDSSPRHPKLATVFELTAQWQKITIDVSALDLSYVLGGFAWVANALNNPNGAVFYLDDIQYDKPRLDDPRFIVSYQTLPTAEDFDLVMRNVAFTYDNAVAALAFMAQGSDDDWRRAELLCDAFVYAVWNDRFYNDGGLRNAYQAGDLILPPGWEPNCRPDTVRMPGFYQDGQWVEDEFQVSRYAGNTAWAMIALLTFNQAKPRPEYFQAAKKMGAWIEMLRENSGYGGYRGGFTGWEPDPIEERWASTEHNLDLVVAFQKLGAATGGPLWQERADHARQFVENMWSQNFDINCATDWGFECGPDCGVFLTGTVSPEMENRMVLPLDPQSWAVLALPGVLAIHPCLLESTRCLLEMTHHGFTGFDFGFQLEGTDNTPDGVWFEGTAQMVVAYQLSQQADLADFYLEQLESAQISAQNSNGKGLVAACHDELSTGFKDESGNPQQYFARLHVAATAWFVFAERGKNPYDLVPCPPDLDGDGNVGASDLITLLAAWGPNPGHPADLDGDGSVGSSDLLTLLAAWGPCP
ncbi:MAG: hypothetical protein V3T53_02260 [Phycisphaerales bacterium]